MKCPADREKNVSPRVNKNVKTSEREANSFSFASGKFAERSVFQGRRPGSPAWWKFVGNGFAGSLLPDTLIQARAITFDYLKNRSVIKMTPSINR